MEDPAKNASAGFENIALLIVPGQRRLRQKFVWVCNGLDGNLILFSIDIGSHFISLASAVPHCTTLPERTRDASLHPNKPRNIGIGGLVKGNWYTAKGSKEFFVHRDACLLAGRRPEIVPSLYTGSGIGIGTGSGGEEAAGDDASSAEKVDEVHEVEDEEEDGEEVAGAHLGLRNETTRPNDTCSD